MGLTIWPPVADDPVDGPASSTDNAVARWDGTTGMSLQNSAAFVDDNGNVYAPNLAPGLVSIATAAGTTTLTVASKGTQVFTGSTTQTVTLPVVSTLPQIGFQYLIINSSSGAVTVNSSGANLVQTIAASGRALITCVLLTGTSAASWSSTYVPILTNVDNTSDANKPVSTAQQAALDAKATALTGCDTLLSSTQVNTNVGTKQALYTVPASKKCIVTKVIVRSVSTSLGAIADFVPFGFNAGADDWTTTTDYPWAVLTSATRFIQISRESDHTGAPGIYGVIGNAAEVFGLIIQDPSIAGTAQVDVFGYLYAA